MSTIKNAYNIAVKTLRKKYRKKGIFAGKNHFDDYWARDSFYASLGSLELGDFKIVKKNLELFLNFQKPNGRIPIRVGRSTLEIVLNGIGLYKKRKDTPRYTEDKGKNIPMDQNSLLIICFYNYIKKTKDIEFLKNHLNKLKKAIQWNLMFDKDKDMLIEEDYFATWADNLKKRGNVLYTNICHCHALYCISELFGFINYKKDQKLYREKYNETKKKINEVFWNGLFYSDWVYKGIKYDYFSTDGNVLAVVFDIADKKKSKRIENSLEKSGINNFVPSLTNLPKYPLKYSTSLQLLLMGIPDYHNGICWLWLGCLDVVAKHKAGMQKDAFSLLKRISEIIIKYNGVYEVYEKTGQPVNRLFYKSEEEFAWSAGLFVRAYSLLYQNDKKQ
ncbi:hypothetical protein GF327_04395 [Candidatus Woesearchaeota archaeon]|nr:hypothetical protein [Candidatus Woesearchaeota archaeon]